MALVPFPSKSAKAAAEPPDPDWDDGPEDEPDGAGKMSFLEHLDELRRRIIYSVVALVGGILIACIFLRRLYDFVMEPMQAALLTGPMPLCRRGSRSGSSSRRSSCQARSWASPGRKSSPFSP